MSPEEITIIQRFIRIGKPDSELRELWQRKYKELSRYLDDRVPNTTVTWRSFLENNGVLCPLETFLMTLKALMEDAELPHKIALGARYPALRDTRLSLLKDLDEALSMHKHPCESCPVLRLRVT